MTRLLLASLAAAAFATIIHAQPPGGGEPPNADTDHDGKVTLAEFKAANAERQTRMFVRMDTNKDGKITAAEIDAGRNRAEADGRGPPGGERPAQRGSEGFMMRLDVDKDGAVSKAEMSAMTGQRFKRADTNDDGWLSKGELLMMRRGMRGLGGPE